MDALMGDNLGSQRDSYQILFCRTISALRHFVTAREGFTCTHIYEYKRATGMCPNAPVATACVATVCGSTCGPDV